MSPQPDLIDICLDAVLAHEGGFVDHPDDPGGATRYGITRKTLGQYRGRRATKADVRALTKGEARQIYLELYWAPIKADRLPGPVALVVFDAAVNQGVGRAAIFLQRAIGSATDGVVGPNTLQATAERWSQNRQRLIDEICARRMNHYGGLGIFRRFGLGWSRRLMAIHSNATRMNR